MNHVLRAAAAALWLDNRNHAARRPAVDPYTGWLLNHIKPSLHR